MKQATLRTMLAISLLVLWGSNVQAADKPLKVYILAGQSNMVGSGEVRTFDYIGEDPKTAPMLKLMRGPDGKPTVGKRVWISSFTGKQNQQAYEYAGKLCIGLGSRRDHSQLGECIGPEYTFGLVLEQAYEGPILIIKTAWGGQSLSLHYRSPSAGPYEFTYYQKEMFALAKRPESKQAQMKQQSGQNYRWMIDHVKKVLKDIRRVYPDYNEEVGHEFAGFVWFQGWNDYCDTWRYPLELGEKEYVEYSVLLAHFIRDVRKDLSAPKMPFVIGIAGWYGNFTPGTFDPRWKAEARMRAFRKAMAEPAKLPEFKGNVITVQTAPFWDKKLAAISMKLNKVHEMRNAIIKQSKGGPNAEGKMTKEQMQEFLEKYRKELISAEEEALMQRAAGGGGFVHYHGSAKFYAQAGKAFAEALIAWEKK
jgi:alpha-galactosidase